MLNRTHLMAAVAYVPFSVVLAVFYCSTPPSPDQSIFDYMAWLSLHGAPHYAGAFDVTWPGQLIVHDIGLALFGVHPWTARLTDFLYLQLGVAALCGFAAGAGYARAGLALMFVYPLIYVTSGDWMAGHRDILAMHLLIGSAALTLLMPRRRLLAGILTGYATATRPTYLFFAAWLAIDDLVHGWCGGRKLAGPAAKTAVFGVGIAIVAFAFVAAGVAVGSLAAWYDQAVKFVVEVYPVGEARGRLIPLFFRHVAEQWNWLAAAATMGGSAWLLTTRNTYSTSLFIGMVATVIVSFVVQNKGFAYHLGGLVPLMTLAACIGVEVAWTRWRHPDGSRLRPAVLSAGITACLVLTLGLALRAKNNLVQFVATGMEAPARYDRKISERDRMVAIIRSESGENDHLFQFGWKYDVVFLSQRPSPTRYINAPAMTLIDAHDSRYSGWLTQFESDLERRPPKFILVERSYWRINAEKPIVQILRRAIAGHYSVRARGETMDLLKWNADPISVR